MIVYMDEEGKEHEFGSTKTMPPHRTVGRPVRKAKTKAPTAAGTKSDSDEIADDEGEENGHKVQMARRVPKPKKRVAKVQLPFPSVPQCLTSTRRNRTLEWVPIGLSQLLCGVVFGSSSSKVPK